MLPRSGGDKVYLEFIFRRPRFLASTMVAISAVLLGFTASNCIIFGEYILFAFGIEPTPFVQRTLAVGLLTLITIIHGCFMKTGIWIQNVLGWAKILVMVFMVFAGLFALTFSSKIDPPPSTDILSWSKLWEGSIWGFGTISTAVFKAMYSFAGYSNVNNVLNEVKDPVRTLETVAPAALFTITIFYLMLNIAYFVVVPLDSIKESGELIAALFFERIFGSGFGRTVLPLLIAISAAGNVMVVTFTLVGISGKSIFLEETINTLLGTCQSRNCSPRLPPFLPPLILFSPLQFSFRGPYSPLHTFYPRHHITTPKRCLRIYPRRRGLSWHDFCSRNLFGNIMVAEKSTRSEEAVQGVESSDLVKNHNKFMLGCCAICASKRWSVGCRILVCDVCGCWRWHVSNGNFTGL